MYPNSVPVERDIPFPEPMLYLFIYACQSSPKGVLLQNGGNNNATLHGAPRGRKVYIQWGAVWLPRGWMTTLLPLPQCHAALTTIPTTLAWIDQNPLASVCRSNPQQRLPYTLVTASHMTQGRIEYESIIP